MFLLSFLLRREKEGEARRGACEKWHQLYTKCYIFTSSQRGGKYGQNNRREHNTTDVWVRYENEQEFEFFFVIRTCSLAWGEMPVGGKASPVSLSLLFDGLSAPLESRDSSIVSQKQKFLNTTHPLSKERLLERFKRLEQEQGCKGWQAIRDVLSYLLYHEV